MASSETAVVPVAGSALGLSHDEPVRSAWETITAPVTSSASERRSSARTPSSSVLARSALMPAMLSPMQGPSPRSMHSGLENWPRSIAS